MTTIAYDGRQLAADSLVCLDGSVYEYRSKIDKAQCSINDLPIVMASSGEGQDSYLVLEWLKNGAEESRKPNVSDSFSAIVIYGGYVCQMEYKLFLEPVIGEIAIGSGWKWAKAAMDMGLSAFQAVEYAIKKDVWTGGDIDTFQVENYLGKVQECQI